MPSADRYDAYVVPGTNCLRNRLGLTDPSRLEAIEFRLSMLNAPRAFEALRATPTFSLESWRTAHRLLFEDVYDWAGQIRTTELARGEHQFCPVGMITNVAERRFGELMAENALKGLAREWFVARLAHHFARLDEIHPFREGNGRSLRLVASVLAHQAGYVIDWGRATKAEQHARAAEAYAARSGAPLEPVFARLVRPLDAAARVPERDDRVR